MLSGEYAVLDGAISIVAAVQARATATFVREDAEMTTRVRKMPEAAAARAAAERRLGRISAELNIDVRKLRRGDLKLGVGSSAAAAACAAGAVYRHFGLDINEDNIRRRVLADALEGHCEIAPQGSGADVAASVLGGFISYRRLQPEGAKNLTWPEGLAAKIIWTGVESRTSDLVKVVRAFQQRLPKAYDKVMDDLIGRANRFAAAFSDGDCARIVELAADYGDGMYRLGKESGAGIAHESLSQIAALASTFEGGAKPSGAGGGDVAIAFFQGAEAADAFANAATQTGMTIVELPLGGPGLATL